jgi:Rha family phage regulatory protein
MKQLVEVHKGEVYCDSQNVADKFGYRHLHVTKVIKRLITDLDTIKGSQVEPLKYIEEEREYRGQKFKVYLMDRRAFSLLSMRFTGPKALEWQIKFNDAFYLMEKTILLAESNKGNAAWVTQRKQGIEARKSETDTIKQFVDYAISQGSQSAQFYYKHMTVACYRCLNLVEAKQPKLRDTLAMMELNLLMMAEHIAEKSMQRHMAAGEHYKTIFVLVKQDLERFADAMLVERPKQIIKKGGK